MPPDPSGGDAPLLCISRARTLSGLTTATFQIYQETVTKQLSVRIQTREPRSDDPGTAPGFGPTRAKSFHPGNIFRTSEVSRFIRETSLPLTTTFFRLSEIPARAAVLPLAPPAPKETRPCPSSRKRRRPTERQKDHESAALRTPSRTSDVHGASA